MQQVTAAAFTDPIADPLRVAVLAAIALTGIDVEQFYMSRVGHLVTVRVNGSDPVYVEADPTTMEEMESLALEVAAQLAIAAVAQPVSPVPPAAADAIVLGAAPVAGIELTKPTMIRAKSSSIAEFGYGGGALYVRFVAGKLYRYDGVSQEDFAIVRDATSIGRQMALTITPYHKGVLVPEAGA